jgi:hypothetical protein
MTILRFFSNFFDNKVFSARNCAILEHREIATSIKKRRTNQSKLLEQRPLSRTWLFSRHIPFLLRLKDTIQFSSQFSERLKRDYVSFFKFYRLHFS